MTHERIRLGASGEERAAAWLESKGYKIIATNWRCPLGEIDLIAQKKDILAICEVKTRRTGDYGSPFEAITPRKQRRLRKLGEYYWCFVNERRLRVRFDALAVYDRGDEIIVDHIENAF